MIRILIHKEVTINNHLYNKEQYSRIAKIKDFDDIIFLAHIVEAPTKNSDQNYKKNYPKEHYLL